MDWRESGASRAAAFGWGAEVEKSAWVHVAFLSDFALLGEHSGQQNAQ
jgi:hypothetical protein